MSYTTEIENSVINAKSTFLNPELTENPSPGQLLSYGFCCVVQGLVWICYLALVLFVPLAIRQGLF